MARNKALPIFWFLLLSNFCTAQVEEINGKINASSNLEGVHVINKTSKFYSTTNLKGEFKIKGKLNDTLVFSSVQYKLSSVKITSEIISNKILIIELVDHVNQLNEVYVGNNLTGNLEDDIGNSKVKPDINFYDVGIPGYKGKPKTIKERRLIEADHGKYFAFYGIGFAINVNKILNKVSGRTAILKYKVELEKKDELMFRLKAKFSNDLFNTYGLEEDKRMDFFFFCSEDDNFLESCSSRSDLKIFDYLKNKLLQYKSNQLSKD